MTLAESTRLLQLRKVIRCACSLNLAAMGLAMVLGLVLAPPALAETSAPPITRIQDIRKLDREQAAMAHPVRLTGVVVWQGGWDFFIHDGSASIWVSFAPGPGPNTWQGPPPHATIGGPAARS